MPTVVLGLLPEDFDRIEFQAVRRQMHHYQTVVDHPVIELFLVNAMMNPGVIQHDQGQWQVLLAPSDTVEQLNGSATVDGLLVQVMPNLTSRPIQCTHDIHSPTGNAGIGNVMFAFRSAYSLYVGDIEKATLIQIEHADFALTGHLLAPFKFAASKRAGQRFFE